MNIYLNWMASNARGEDDHSRTIIHIDLDCFYAQVEMIKNPKLRNVPLGIQQKNIVVTSNYQAREYGVKKCMLVTEAKKLCPKIVLVNGEDLSDYRKLSYELTTLLQQYTNLIERLGFDENFIDISDTVNQRLSTGSGTNFAVIGNTFGDNSDICQCGCENRLRLGTVIAQEIRNAIKTKLELTSCAGIAHNKLLAKIVGSKHKPNQQTVVFPNSAVELLNSLKSVENIPGIGRATVDLLKTVNVQTILELQNVEPSVLIKLFNADKSKLFMKLSFGIDNTPVKRSGKPQSIGLEDSCRLISAEKEVREKLQELLNRLLILVNSDGRFPRTIKLTVRIYDKATKTSHRETKQSHISPKIFSSLTNSMPTPNKDKLMQAIMDLFKRIVKLNKPFHITLLGLSFTKFNERPSLCNSVASFLRRDIEVQSIISIKSDETKNSPDSTASTSTTTELSESEIEPSPKRGKFNIIAKRRCFSNFDDCESPSKLRVAELRLNSIEKHDNNQNIQCPPNADHEIFKELPLDVQQELWEDYKRKRDVEHNICASQAKKPKTNTLFNYFIKN